jgi:hypothetical protein
LRLPHLKDYTRMAVRQNAETPLARLRRYSHRVTVRDTRSDSI